MCSTIRLAFMTESSATHSLSARYTPQLAIWVILPLCRHLHTYEAILRKNFSDLSQNLWVEDNRRRESAFA